MTGRQRPTLARAIRAALLTGPARAKVFAILKQLGLQHRRFHHPLSLSGGEQQRVAIARALVNEPEILLADEPTGNLDTATGAVIVEALFDLQKRHGATLVMVTHAPELADKCDRTIRIEDGLAIETRIEAAA